MSLHKIHTRIVIDSLTGKVEEDEFYWHDTDKDGPISQLGGGGGGDGDGDFDDAAMEAEAVAGSTVGGAGSGDIGGGADVVADFTGPGPSGAPGTGGPVDAAPEADDGLEPGGMAPATSDIGHPDHGLSGVAPSGAAGSGMESDVGGAASMGLLGTSGGGATSSFGDFGGMIDPTWGWDIDSAATYGYGHGLTAAGKPDWGGAGEEDDDDIDGGSDTPAPGAPSPGAPVPGAPGAPAPGTPGGPLPGSIIPPWWSGSPHAEYEWGRYGTPYAIPSPRWEGGDVPGHLTGYMPHYEGLLENAYTYPDIKALGLIYGAPPPAPPAEEEDDDDDGEEEESGGETE